MGNDISVPREQRLWRAANLGDHHKLREGLGLLTPDNRRFLEWKDAKWGRTPLSQAAHKGHFLCVAALVESGANPRACDDKNNTPLHLACRQGHGDIVRFLVSLQPAAQVPLYEVNLGVMTPLDVARDQRLRRLADPGPTRSVIGYDQCITDIERKTTVFSGWLYEKTETVLSWITGLHEVTTWKHRFCLVLQRGDPEVLELACFSMSKGDVRPIQPRSVFLVHLRSGVVETTDTKWTYRKAQTFQLSGFVLHRDDERGDDRRQVARAKTTEFAALDPAGLEAWKRIFQSQQDALATAPLPASSYSYSIATAPTEPEPEVTRAEWMDDNTGGGGVEKPWRSEQTQAAVETEATRQTQEADQRETTDQATEAEQDTEAGSPTQEMTHDRVEDGEAPAAGASGECVVCFDGPQNAVCVPCGHNAVCMDCAEQLTKTSHECPVCRGQIREVIQFFRV